MSDLEKLHLDAIEESKDYVEKTIESPEEFLNRRGLYVGNLMLSKINEGGLVSITSVMEDYVKEYCTGNQWLVIDSIAASKSAQITKDIAVNFCRWIISNPLTDNYSSMSKETAISFFDKFLRNHKI